MEETKNSKGNEEEIWRCEFCNTDNIVDLYEEEKPITKSINYIVEAASQVKDKEDKQPVEKKQNSIVFCLDQSASMQTFATQSKKRTHSNM